MDFTVSGDTAPDLVLLHGIQGTRAGWSAIAKDLTSDFRCILPNFEGRGKRKNNFTHAGLSLERYASELDSIVQANAQPGFVLIGWSLGVSVILEYLKQYEHEHIGGIVLVSGSPALNECRWFHHSDPAELEAEILEREQRLQLSEAAHPAAVATLWSSIKNVNHEDVLANIKLPCLVIHGEDDEDCPIEHGRRLGSQIPQAKLVEVAGAGHSVLRSHPELVSQQIREFVQHL